MSSAATTGATAWLAAFVLFADASELSVFAWIRAAAGPAAGTDAESLLVWDDPRDVCFCMLTLEDLRVNSFGLRIIVVRLAENGTV
jgi:hypothetical protein